MAAPPPESEPAMVSTCLSVVVMEMGIARCAEKSAYIYVDPDLCPGQWRPTPDRRLAWRLWPPHLPVCSSFTATPIIRLVWWGRSASIGALITGRPGYTGHFSSFHAISQNIHS